MFIKPKICILIIVLLSSPVLLSAQEGYYYKLGGNYSRFRNVDTQMKPGVTLGLGYEWKIKKNGGFAIEVSYINRKGLLKNKSIGSGTGFDLDISFRDIDCSIAFLEPQFQFQYYFPIKNNLKLKLSSGLSLSLSFLDMSEKKLLKRISLEPNERYNYKFDYIVAYDPGPYIDNSSGFGLNFGFGIVWSFLSFEYRYFYTLNDIGMASNIVLKEKMDTMHLILGFSLDELLSLL